MKKFTRWVLALALCLALAVTAALAEEAPITVQLDGQALSFTDAVPQVKDQRTFLPFRAVFEAMGAEVSYEGSVITAARGDKSLTMTLDQTTATVAENGKAATITMDVAPYVDPATWRTYVPVRFAAQAFDCVVGWDQEAQTAIIVDTDKLLAAATEGKHFTYLEKLMAYSEKYSSGIWDMTADFDADVSVMGMPMTMRGTVRGTVQDSDKMDMDMNMKLDLSQFLSMSAAASGQSLSVEDALMAAALGNVGVDLSMRGDMAQGKVYMNMDMGVLGAQSGLDPNTWYQMDMAAMMERMGMDWNALMAQSQNMDMRAAVKAMLAASEPTDAATAYSSVKDTLEQALAALADESFVKESLEEGDEYTAILDLTQGNVTATVVLVLGMKDDAVAAYSMGMDVAADNTAMYVTVSVDDEDQMYAEVGMDAAGLMTLDMAMEGAYTPGTAAPSVTPPTGVKVVDFMDLTGGLG